MSFCSLKLDVIRKSDVFAANCYLHFSRATLIVIKLKTITIKNVTFLTMLHFFWKYFLKNSDTERYQINIQFRYKTCMFGTLAT
jgi:hypothetical protein